MGSPTANTIDAAPAEAEAPLDYARVAQAIAYLRAAAPRQPSLTEVAAEVHLSPAHFQRRFTAWAGISPKQFARRLTVAYAKTLLAPGSASDAAPSLFTVAERAGLSSPSRLHEAFLRVEAMTPGEWRGGGAGARVAYAFAGTRFGESLIAATGRGICSLSFLADDGEAARAEALAVLRKRYPHADLQAMATPTDVQRAALDIVDGAAADPTRPLALHLRGTPFQHQVWRALLTLAPGEADTYAGLAGRLGRSRGSAQAIGGAVGANRVAWLIPCHRVLRADGGLGGYAWGETRKAAMLAVEGR